MPNQEMLRLLEKQIRLCLERNVCLPDNKFDYAWSEMQREFEL